MGVVILDNGNSDKSEAAQAGVDHQAAIATAIAGGDAPGAADDATGPDNNHELAEHKEAIAKLRAHLETLSGGAVLVDLEPNVVVDSAIEKLDHATRQIDDLAAFMLAKHSEAIVGGAVESAIALIEDLAAEGNEAAGELIITLQGQVSDLELQLQTAKKVALEKGTPAAKVAKARDPKSRKFGRLKVGGDEKGRAEARIEQLRKLFAEGGTPFEIVFSDGKGEILELDPIEVAASDFTKDMSRLSLKEPVEVKGSDHELQLDGFALIHEGEQIDYCALLEPLTIAPNEHRRFAQTIHFGG